MRRVIYNPTIGELLDAYRDAIDHEDVMISTKEIKARQDILNYIEDLEFNATCESIDQMEKDSQ